MINDRRFAVLQHRITTQVFRRSIKLKMVVMLLNNETLLLPSSFQGPIGLDGPKGEQVGMKSGASQILKLNVRRTADNFFSLLREAFRCHIHAINVLFSFYATIQ